MIKNKDFNLLLIGRFITNFGDSIYTIATLLLVYSMTQSSFYTGLALFLTASTAIFQVLLSPILNKINLKKFLISTQIFQGFLLILLMYLLIKDMLEVKYLLLIMTLISFINQLVYPSQIALLPKLLSSEELIKGNSLFSIAYQGSDAIFNALGGYIISLLGFAAAYLLNSITFFINAFLFLFLSTFLSKPLDKSKISILDHFSNLKKDLKIWRKPLLKSIIAGVLIINFASTAIFAVLPELSVNKNYYGILVSATGIGVILGSMLAGQKNIKNIKFGKLYSPFIISTSLLWGVVPFVDSQFLLGKILIFFLFLIGWIFIGILNIYSQTLVQKSVSAENLSVAISSMIGLSVAIAPFGALGAGILSKYVDITTIICIASGLIFWVGILWGVNHDINSLGKIDEL